MLIRTLLSSSVQLTEACSWEQSNLTNRLATLFTLVPSENWVPPLLVLIYNIEVVIPFIESPEKSVWNEPTLFSVVL